MIQVKGYPKRLGGEMADTPALGAGIARCGGSSPLPGTRHVVSDFVPVFLALKCHSFTSTPIPITAFWMDSGHRM